MVTPRRGVLRMLGVAGAGWLSGCQTLRGPQRPKTDQNWPMFRGDVRNSGTVPATTGPTRGVSEAWHFDIDDDPKPPSVADGTVYACGRYFVYALDAGSGEQLLHWRSDANGSSSSPVVVNDTIYLATGGGVSALTEPRWNW